MRKRSKARARLLQILYAWEIKGGSLRDEAEAFWEERRVLPGNRAYALQLIDALEAQLPTVDEHLRRVLANWEIGRLGSVERNILRLAICELLCLPEIPPKVAIDEAIELARRYGTPDSPRFVNGILDAVYRELREGSVALP